MVIETRLRAVFTSIQHPGQAFSIAADFTVSTNINVNGDAILNATINSDYVHLTKLASSETCSGNHVARSCCRH